MTPREIAETHGISKDLQRKRLRQAGFDFSIDRELSEPEKDAILNPAKKRKGTRTKTANKVSANETAVQIVRERTEVKSVNKKAEPSALSGHFLRTDGFLFSALIVTMSVQMLHTGGFFWLNSPTDNFWLRLLWSAGFAYGVDCTALVMTMQPNAGKGFLWAFAFIHLAMNLALHWQTHGFTAWTPFLGYVLLSGVLAFSNFSYTDLFSKK